MFASDSPEHADGERRGAKTGSVELVPTTGHAFAYFSDRAHRQASVSPDVLKKKKGARTEYTLEKPLANRDSWWISHGETSWQCARTCVQACL